MRYLFPFLHLYIRAWSAARYAGKRDLIGMEFNRFGRSVACRLLRKASLPGVGGYLLNPVSSTRYFEFPFALSCLSNKPEKCLDVSSPRLFSLYVAEKLPLQSILMINPDIRDLCHTINIVRRLGVNAIQFKNRGVESLASQCEMYDCIWSISVIEHIEGEYNDTKAIRLMYNALKKGGRLILTFPVDRHFWDEYRDIDPYGTQSKCRNKAGFFFQHFYDKAAIWERLLTPIDREPSAIRWFGETSPGIFAEYIERWTREGYECTVIDPQHIVDHYREFESWEEMPGMGVCGLMIEKPA